MPYKYARMDASQIDLALKTMYESADTDNNGLIAYIEDGTIAFDTYDNLFTFTQFHTEEYLTYSNLSNILTEAYVSNFPTDLSVSNWGGLTINNTRTGTNLYVADNAVVMAECVVSSEYVSYNLPETNMPMTGYAVARGYAGRSGRIFGVRDSDYATKGWRSTYYYQYSNGSTDVDTSVQSGDSSFHVFAYRVNDGATSMDFFLDGSKVGTLSISSIGYIMRFGCVDGTTIYDGTTYYKFLGIVDGAESDSVILANTNNLKTKFNIT